MVGHPNRPKSVIEGCDAVILELTNLRNEVASRDLPDVGSTRRTLEVCADRLKQLSSTTLGYGRW